jgi:hypothetical protein
MTTLDLTQNCDFNYLEPNETHPIDAKEHLQWDASGILVSTGTVRSLFDLTMVDPEKCTGLVIRDINPQVKAYIDFEILLIRLASSHEEYQELAMPLDYTDVEDKNASYLLRLNRVNMLLAQSNLSPELKGYYHTYLEQMATLYFTHQCVLGEDTYWKESASFKEVNYYQDAELFSKLQTYAKEGKILTTVGSIEDLEFLGEERIGLIDISNIADYALLDFKRAIPEKILFTHCLGIDTEYHSYRYESLTEQEAQELHSILAILSSIHRDHTENTIIESLLDILSPFNQAGKIAKFSHHRQLYYCKELLKNLRKFKQLYLYQTAVGPWVDLSSTRVFFPLETLKKSIGQDAFRAFVKQSARRLLAIQDLLIQEERDLGKEVAMIIANTSSPSAHDIYH